MLEQTKPFRPYLNPMSVPSDSDLDKSCVDRGHKLHNLHLGCDAHDSSGNTSCQTGRGSRRSSMNFSNERSLSATRTNGGIWFHSARVHGKNEYLWYLGY